MSERDSGDGRDFSLLRRGNIHRLSGLRDHGNRAFEIGASVMLFVIMLITVSNAVGRYLINRPIAGTVEFVELYLMIGLIWLAIVPLQLGEKNIKLDLLSQRFSEFTSALIKSIYLPAITIVMILALRGVYIRTMELYRAGATTTGTVQFPTYLSMGLLTFGLASLCFVLLVQSLGSFSKTIDSLRGRIIE